MLYAAERIFPLSYCPSLYPVAYTGGGVYLTLHFAARGALPPYSPPVLRHCCPWEYPPIQKFCVHHCLTCLYPTVPLPPPWFSLPFELHDDDKILYIIYSTYNYQSTILSVRDRNRISKGKCLPRVESKSVDRKIKLYQSVPFGERLRGRNTG